MGGLILLLIIFGAIWLLLYLAKQFEEAARMKGHYEGKYFWLCFFFSIIGYLLVIALPDRGNTPKAISDELPGL